MMKRKCLRRSLLETFAAASDAGGKNLRKLLARPLRGRRESAATDPSPSGRPRNAGGLFATARPRDVVSGDMSAAMSSTSVYKSTSASSALLSDGTATQSRRRRVDGVEAAVKI